jgi:hypothetical protein
MAPLYVKRLGEGLEAALGALLPMSGSRPTSPIKSAASWSIPRRDAASVRGLLGHSAHCSPLEPTCRLRSCDLLLGWPALLPSLHLDSQSFGSHWQASLAEDCRIGVRTLWVWGQHRRLGSRGVWARSAPERHNQPGRSTHPGSRSHTGAGYPHPGAAGAGVDPNRHGAALDGNGRRRCAVDPEMSRVRKLTSKPCRFACWQSTAPPRATF